MTERLETGDVIGILGGGQLGRMLSVAAARLGLRTHIFEPGAAPAGDVAHRVTQASYEDADALRAFARDVKVVTYEFENIPTSALDILEDICPIRPGREALRVSQDRLAEKTYLQDLGLTPAPFADVPTLEALRDAVEAIGSDGILKTRRFGYDGKGQVRLRADTDLAQAWAALDGAPAILEGFVPFEREISVIAARGLDGSVVAYDPGENLHEAGILRSTAVPATISARLRADAVLMAGRVLNALDYVGVLGIEFFATADGLVVNEIAPRVHNSGHWTQNGCVVDQFEQHIRAVAGWPLGDGTRYADIKMINLIGDDARDVAGYAGKPDYALHIYGKAEIKPGRKMGHVNQVLKR